MIRIKAKAMFDEKTDDPAVKESFVASSGWIQNFMKRHHLSCRSISYLWYLVLIFFREFAHPITTPLYFTVA